MTVEHTEKNKHLTYQEIARFSQRALSDEQQVTVQRHCADCADCRTQLSLAMEMLGDDNSMAHEPEFAKLLATGQRAAQRALLAETAAEAAHEAQARRTAANARPTDWFRLWLRPALVTLAVVACVTLPLGWWWTARESSLDRSLDRSMASLRQSWTVNRPLESRVTGGFPPLPFERVRSANSNSPSLPINTDQLLVAEVELKRAVADYGTPQARHALARLHLLKGEFDLAEAQLKQVIKAQPNNAEALGDLSALEFERWAAAPASDPKFTILLRASEAATKAVELAPKLPEAWFNRAIIDEQMYKMAQAQQDWERFLELDSTSKWAEEARDRLAKLRARATLPEPQPDKLTADMRAALTAHDDVTSHKLLDEHFTLATDLFATRWMDEYLSAAENKAPEAAAQGAFLAQLATLIRDTRGDHFFTDMWQGVAHSPPTRIAQLRALREQLQQSQQEYLTGNYQTAMKLAAAAAAAAVRLGDDCHAETALYYQARIYTPETETPHLSALRELLLAKTTRQHHLQIQAKNLLARSNQLGAERKFSQWLSSTLQAKEIATHIKDLDLAILSLSSLGTIYSRLGEPAQGIESHYFAAQRLFDTKINWRRGCGIYALFSISLADFADAAEAYAYQLEALPYCQKGGASIYLPALGRAGRYAALAGKTNESVKLLQLALSNTESDEKGREDHISLIDRYLSLGEALIKGQRYEEAQVTFIKAKERLGILPNFDYLSSVNQGLAAAFLHQGKISEAEGALRESVELSERARNNVTTATQRNHFVSSKLNVYRAMVDFQYFYRHMPEVAFNNAEIYRNRELHELLTQTPEINRRKSRTVGGAEPLTRTQVQTRLPPQTQLIEYAITDHRLLIWVISQTTCADARVEVTPAQLQQSVEAYLQALVQRQPSAEVNAKSQALYQWLIQPIAGYLKAGHHLVFVPDGLLTSFPFSALVQPDSQRYLVEDYAVSVSPSASLFAELLQRGQAFRTRPSKSLLAVSNPAFDHRLFPRLADLPGAGNEARDLKPFYAHTDQLAGAGATKTAVSQAVKQYDVLHFAAHSLANAREPFLSSLVLASTSAGQAESLWPAHEIFRLRLPRTRLVILSSCNSLISRPSGGNSLGGLAQAFLGAGVPTVIGSLWEVRDESTSALLTAFHRHWRLDKVNTGEALRRAQLELLHGKRAAWRHPLYWAAFHVMGDAITI